MMIVDLHNHTHYCDGKNSPEEMVLSAIDKGVEVLGLVVHGYTDFDNTFCAPKENLVPFQVEMNRLKQKYKDKITLYHGVEQDYFGGKPIDGFDYVIGSLHYAKKDGKYYPLDHSPEQFREMIEAYGGDVYAAAEEYFDNISNIVEKTGAHVVGHFDVFKKFNAHGEFFDENHPRYVNAYNKAMEKLIKTGVIFEMNVGGISRGWIEEPYPSVEKVKYLMDRGVKVIPSSDGHNVQNIAFQYDKWLKVFE